MRVVLNVALSQIVPISCPSNAGFTTPTTTTPSVCLITASSSAAKSQQRHDMPSAARQPILSASLSVAVCTASRGRGRGAAGRRTGPLTACRYRRYVSRSAAAAAAAAWTREDVISSKADGERADGRAGGTVCYQQRQAGRTVIPVTRYLYCNRDAGVWPSALRPVQINDGESERACAGRVDKRKIR